MAPYGSPVAEYRHFFFHWWNGPRCGVKEKNLCWTGICQSEFSGKGLLEPRKSKGKHSPCKGHLHDQILLTL